MAYKRNGGSDRVVDFKDGQPVYKRGRTNNGRANNEGGRQRSGSRLRDDRESFDDRTRSSYKKEGGRGGSAYGRIRGDGGFRRAEGFDENDRRSARVRDGSGRNYPPRTQRPVNRSGARMEDFPHDIRPPREYDNEDRIRGAYRDGRRDGGRNTRSEARPAVVENETPAELPNIIMGRNPVKEAIKAGRSIDRILVTKEHDGSLNEILDLARDAKLVVRDVDRAKLDEICMPFGHNGRPGNHQGIIAYIPGVEYCELSDILDRADEMGQPPFIVLLDGIEDPQNLGSIIRSAECAGAHGVVITKRRSASVTAAVVKTSAGATEHLPIAKVVNLSVAIERLKEAGVWVAGADMEGESLYSSDLTGPFALVIGAEGTGISRLVAEKCDYLVSIPLMGSMESLNASVAAAVIMFEKVRQEKLK